VATDNYLTRVQVEGVFVYLSFKALNITFTQSLKENIFLAELKLKGME
jgi:hypothetical protein